MKSNQIFWVDAFSALPYRGNPAVVCVLEQDLRDERLQAMAKEFNVSETAFILKADDNYSIRWFTPTKELPLVGHATLAAAHVVLSELELDREDVMFESEMSGRLLAFRDANSLAIILPADIAEPCECPPELIDGLGRAPQAVLKGRHYLAVYRDQTEVASLDPEFRALSNLDRPTIAATAPGAQADYVLRFFAPANGVPEDPVSGVAQCSLVPYWASRLSKKILTSEQLSSQGGTMICKETEAGIQVAGPCCTLFSGNLVNF